MTIDGTGGVDIGNERMEMHMDMTLILPNQNKQGMALALYIVDGWVYQKSLIPIIGEKWTKKELTSEIWATQNYVYPQIALLATAEEVSLLSTEAVRGVPCHVVEITPGIEALAELVAVQQAPGTEDVDFSQLGLDDLFREISIKQWIAIDTGLLMRSEVHVLIEITPQDADAANANYKQLNLDFNLLFDAYTYNDVVVIDLPEAALTATEPD
jgi:hypothetical protein